MTKRVNILIVGCISFVTKHHPQPVKFEKLKEFTIRFFTGLQAYNFDFFTGIIFDLAGWMKKKESIGDYFAHVDFQRVFQKF